MSLAKLYEVRDFPFIAKELESGSQACSRKDTVLALPEYLRRFSDHVKRKFPNIERGDVLSTPRYYQFVWSGTAAETLQVLFDDHRIVPSTYVWSDHEEPGCMVVGPDYWEVISFESWPSASTRQKIADSLTNVGGNSYKATLKVKGVEYTFVYNFRDLQREREIMMAGLQTSFLQPTNTLDSALINLCSDLKCKLDLKLEQAQERIDNREVLNLDQVRQLFLDPKNPLTFENVDDDKYITFTIMSPDRIKEMQAEMDSDDEE
jgi:hypothetical protein